MSRERENYRLPIDRTLSPLDKLTRTLTSKQAPPSTLFLNQQQPPPPPPQQQQPSHHQYPFHQTNNLHSSIQSDTSSRYSFDNHHHHSLDPLNFDLDSALAQLSDDLTQLDHSNHHHNNNNSNNHSNNNNHHHPFHPPGPLRRPSVGRVNSSTATTQTPRAHIPSVYGDQELIPPTQSDQNHCPTQPNLDNTQELLRPTQTINDRQTWLSSLSNESESEYDVQSTRYPSGHSTSSEDPFQYWQYEASRQSRDVLSNTNKPTQPHLPPNTTHPNNRINIPASLKPAGPSTSPNPSNTSEELELDPGRTNKKLSTNFSRPLRPPSVHPPSTELLLTPPLSREMSPRDPSSVEQRHQEDHHYSNAAALADTRDILNKTALITSTTAPESPSSNSKTGSIRRLGHAARASIQSRSSIDTNSSSGSRRSWKKFFQIGSKSKEDDPNHSTPTDNPSTNPDHSQLRSPSAEYNPNLPAITFTQSQHERAHPLHHHIQPDHLHHPKAATTAPIPSDRPQVDFHMINQTTYHHPQDAHRLKQRRDPHPGHRLSIYSLPSSDDPTIEDLEQKERYASRSPLLFDTPSSSQLPSPVGEEHQASSSQSAIRRPTFDCPPHQPVRSTSGMPLHSAIAKAKASLAKSGPPSGSKGQTAQDYLQAGIVAHEQGDLERSAGLFERAAREGGGCGAGMLMWGLSLRHGWGCQVHEARAFKWLQKAAESVIDDLDKPNLGASSKAPTNPTATSLNQEKEKDDVAKSELVLAIYELGQCFLRGWGCKKDKQLAINYFELAAKLGDPDAQQELGFCYANGKGTKKDLKLAAKYYRMAAHQGVEMMGSQWIWKDKYN